MRLFRLLLTGFFLATAGLSAQATQIYVVSGTSQTSPLDWNNGNNSVEGIGGGGSGAVGVHAPTQSATGGGGGEYRKIANFAVATPGTTAFNYTIGGGGASVSLSTSNTISGNDGTQTTFNTSSLIAKPGLKGIGAAPTAAGGAGGTGGTGAAANFNGGSGGSSGAFNTVATGGGGAGGPTGAGNNGVAGTVTNTATAGGSADNGGTGAGTAGAGATGTGAQTGGNGGNGSEWDASHGSGGGGGGANSTNSGGIATGGTGGNYGGGGGAANNGNGGGVTDHSGPGGPGIIVLTYTPAAGGAPHGLLTHGVGSLEPAHDPNKAVLLYDEATLAPKELAILDYAYQFDLAAYQAGSGEGRVVIDGEQLAALFHGAAYPDLELMEEVIASR